MLICISFLELSEFCVYLCQAVLFSFQLKLHIFVVIYNLAELVIQIDNSIAQLRNLFIFLQYNLFLLYLFSF